MTSPSSWASVVTPTCVFVGIADREEFDRLALPAKDHRQQINELVPRRNVLTKSLEAEGVMVVFQHWLTVDSPDYIPELGGPRA
ncbi:hypothetical protein [Cupriavidus sp. IDO]|uniref:hypothetical protein n=1 Tax=Cupriavidus sp. IDO TaxID=1539142 RepID=UPI00057919BD|nr:hypothetical protein [Cupriavidus sp. IDO]KWR88806.1 hypothetical protein RM96_18000 [Cupriavidus sp. IDO]